MDRQRCRFSVATRVRGSGAPGRALPRRLELVSIIFRSSRVYKPGRMVINGERARGATCLATGCDDDFGMYDLRRSQSVARCPLDRQGALRSVQNTHRAGGCPLGRQLCKRVPGASRALSEPSFGRLLGIMVRAMPNRRSRAKKGGRAKGRSSCRGKGEY